jgi:hypothetical protein
VLTDKIIVNKFYLYAGDIHKVKKIQKSKNKIILQNIKSLNCVEMPIEGSDLLLVRLYTIGEVSKIVERRADTIRKYEKSGLLEKPTEYSGYDSYSSWRFYTTKEVRYIMDFFSDRTPGRPSSHLHTSWNDLKLQNLNNKVTTINRSF